ncbi:pyridoxal-phosphate dependent enzyme [Microtetraspora sp. NBRC 13810]|uniref:PLP-dependent cysteine synthase family protein n=1 Tax=Microtetraspora sp. NBRC 13810 TaxID=3030990 RepID=UPI002557C025|nr:pyridoxal-phosphate dependent enzyme [Microtetraspora sp. NBRC 13810]
MAGYGWAAGAISKLEEESLRCGPTPLREFPLPAGWGVRLWLKDESAHPTGSLRHRHARALFRFAIASGRIHGYTTVVEATGGNSAVAQAYFARLLGLKYIAVMPGDRERSAGQAAMVEELGGECRFHNPPPAIYDEARRLAEDLGGHYLDQFTWAERAIDWQDPGLAGELFDQMPEEPEWVVAGAATGATSAALGRRVRVGGYRTKVAVADPENSAYDPGWLLGVPDYATGMPSRIEGIGRPKIEPGFMFPLVDLVVPVPDAASVAAARQLRAVTGLPVGGSSGTTLWAAVELLAKMRARETKGSVVAILGDASPRHLRTYHDDGWAAGKGLDVRRRAAALDRFLAEGVW